MTSIIQFLNSKPNINQNQIVEGPMLRFASTAFGAGFGAGAAWAKCSQEIEVEKKV